MIQEVREIYLRDDIYCGANVCKICETSRAPLDSASTILILDTNVILHQVFIFLFVPEYYNIYSFIILHSNENENFIIIYYFVVTPKIDLLENPAINNAVLLSVVLDEVKNKNMGVYNRIRALSTNPLRKFYVFSNQFHKSVFSFFFLYYLVHLAIIDFTRYC